MPTLVEILINSNNSIITYIILVIFLSFISNIFTRFIDFCFNENNIFDFYYKFLLSIKDKYFKLTKPLGLCPICMGFWFALFIFILFSIYYPLNYIWFIPYISFNFYLNYKSFID